MGGSDVVLFEGFLILSNFVAADINAVFQQSFKKILNIIVKKEGEGGWGSDT